MFFIVAEIMTNITSSSLLIDWTSDEDTGATSWLISYVESPGHPDLVTINTYANQTTLQSMKRLNTYDITVNSLDYNLVEYPVKTMTRRLLYHETSLLVEWQHGVDASAARGYVVRAHRLQVNLRGQITTQNTFLQLTDLYPCTSYDITVYRIHEGQQLHTVVSLATGK